MTRTEGLTRPEPADDGLVRAARPGSPSSVRRLPGPAVVAVLAAVAFAVLGVRQAALDSLTWDEGIYLAAGLATLEFREVQVNFEHPPLAKVAAALPVLLADPMVPDTDALRRGAQFTYAAELVAANRAAGNLDRLILLNRLVPLAVTVAAGAVLYRLARRLYSPWAGAAAAVAWFCQPFVLGLGHLNATDVPFTLCVVSAALLLVRRIQGASAGPTLAALGVTCGAGLLTRSTGLVLLPAVCLLLVWFERRRPARGLLLAAAVAGLAVATLWAGYAVLDGPAVLPAQAGLEILTADAPEEPPGIASLVTALPLPAAYELGVGYLARVSVPEAPAFLLGHSFDGTTVWYWPGSALVKLVPATTAVLLAAGAMWLWNRRRPAREPRAAGAGVVASLAAALTAFTVLQPRPIGLRYLLPALALAFALAAWLPVRLARGTTVARTWCAALAIVQVMGFASAHTHAIAWTSQPFRPGYRFVADSNLDWSQDVGRVAHWAAGRRPWVALFGGPGSTLEQVPGARQLLGVDPTQVSGDVAVFASLLTTYKRDELSWLRAYCSVGTIGGSVVLYHIPAPADPSPGPEQPAGACAGDVSTRVDRPPRPGAVRGGRVPADHLAGGQGDRRGRVPAPLPAPTS